MTALLTAAGVAIAIFGWEACWRLGDIRDDQELRESGVVLGPTLGFVAIVAVSIISPPVTPLGPAPLDVAAEWVLVRAVNVWLLGVAAVVALEVVFVESGRIETHDALLVGSLFGGEES